MLSTAIYKFPQLHDLPDGLNIEMFRRKGNYLYPGTHFEAIDNGKDYCILMFLHRDVEENENGIRIRTSDIINVKCKKIRSIE